MTMSHALRETRATIREADPKLSPDDETFKIAVVLLGAATGKCEHSVQSIVRFARVDADLAQRICDRAARSGLWRGGKTYANWTDAETGDIEFWLNVMEIQGIVARVSEPDR